MIGEFVCATHPHPTSPVKGEELYCVPGSHSVRTTDWPVKGEVGNEGARRRPGMVLPKWS